MDTTVDSRCMPADAMAQDAYARIERAIGFLRARHAEQPALRELACHLGLSESHTQRLFSRWAGVSPKRFVQLLTVADAKRRMAQTADLLSLSLDAGLSGPGRLHDLFVNLEAMSPGEFRCAARGVRIHYGLGDTPFGTALVAATPRGICHLSFVDRSASAASVTALRAAWPEAHLVRHDERAAALLRRIFARPAAKAARGLSLWVSGTNFQVQVWRALLQVPFAGLLSYRQLAVLAGRPGAARAVGSALARNPVAFLIPCHRVLRDSGDFGVYHWGSERKAAICAWEAATSETHPVDA
jgi:AraC family transcriptional regulator of adaptative response/methylated-DNA-[protein]-cysteine methyltransferase